MKCQHLHTMILRTWYIFQTHTRVIRSDINWIDQQCIYNIMRSCTSLLTHKTSAE